MAGSVSILALLALVTLLIGPATFLSAAKEGVAPRETVPDIGPDLEISKTLIAPAGGMALIGDTVSFRIRIKNVGTSAATRVNAWDRFETPCLAYLPSAPVATDRGTGVLEWYDLTAALGDILPGGSIEFTAHFRANALCASAINRVTVMAEYADGTVSEWPEAVAAVAVVLALPTATPTPTVPSGTARPLQVTKTLISPLGGQAVVSDTLIYRIVFQNVDMRVATGVGATDLYPAACMRYVSSVPAGGDDGAGKLMWQDLTTVLGDLAPGQSFIVTTEFQAIAPCAPATNAVGPWGVYHDGSSIAGLIGNASVVIGPRPPTPTPTATPITGVCVAGGYPDYAPSGMPDFSQRQAGWTNMQSGAWSYCGPASAANALWWLDSRFESNSEPPPAAHDNYGLVIAMHGASWDDHDARNLPLVVSDLAYGVDVDGQRTGSQHAGTRFGDLLTGVGNLIAGLDLHAHALSSPNYEAIRDRALGGESLILLLGFWEFQTEGWRRLGGHYVTVAGVECDGDGRRLAISDPNWDRAADGGPGMVRPANRRASMSPMSQEAHNDAALVSWDLYDFVAPGGAWGNVGLAGYATGQDALAFVGQNFAQDLEIYRTGSYQGGEIVTIVDHAISVGPGAATATPTPTATQTPTGAPTATASSTPSATVTGSPSATGTPTETPSASPTRTDTAVIPPPIIHLVLVFRRLP